MYTMLKWRMLCQWSSLPMTALPASQPIHSLKKFSQRRSHCKLSTKTTRKRWKTQQKNSAFFLMTQWRAPFTWSEVNSTAVDPHPRWSPTQRHARAWPGNCARDKSRLIDGYQTTARLLDANRLLAAADHIPAGQRPSQANPATVQCT